MCKIARDFLIGTIAGIVSSLIVSFIWNKIVKKIEKNNADNDEREQFIESFLHDVHQLCRYLEKIQLELEFPESEQKREEILRLLNTQPETKSFKYGMNDEGINILLRIYNVKQEIENYAKKNDLNRAICQVKKSELFNLEFELFKKQNEIRKPWSQYKESINIKIGEEQNSSSLALRRMADFITK